MWLRTVKRGGTKVILVGSTGQPSKTVAAPTALATYPGSPEHTTDNFLVPAQLDSLPGPAGALVPAGWI